MRTIAGCALSLILAAAGSAAASAGPPPGITETATCGAYSVTLRVLRAEPFARWPGAMVWDGGAQPVRENAPLKPNHHLVVFVRRDGKPVEDAAVVIRYRETKPREDEWATLHVARMHVAGKGPATTHYGNNVELMPGSYVVEVTVNGSVPAIFHLGL
jgi:hypothetical protein